MRIGEIIGLSDEALAKKMLEKIFDLTLNLPPDPLMNKLKGIYRYTWAKNQQIFSVLKPIFTTLSQAKIPMMFLKGASLSLKNYDNIGLRPMVDLDLLIEEKHAIKTIKIFHKNQWKRNYLVQKVYRYSPSFLQVFSAMSFISPDNIECDLHWRVPLYEKNQKKGIEAELWRHSESIKWNGIEFSTPSSTEQLLHVCIHGMEYNEVPTIRWVADAMTILKTNPHIDWNHLEKIAFHHGLVLPLRETMNYLYHTFKAPIPKLWLQKLKQMVILNEEKNIYRIHSLKREALSAYARWKKQIKNLWNCHTGKSSFFKAFTFPFFLKKFLGLSSLFFLPFYFFYLQFLFFRKNTSSFFKNTKLSIKRKIK